MFYQFFVYMAFFIQNWQINHQTLFQILIHCASLQINQVFYLVIKNYPFCGTEMTHFSFIKDSNWLGSSWFVRFLSLILVKSE